MKHTKGCSFRHNENSQNPIHTRSPQVQIHATLACAHIKRLLECVCVCCCARSVRVTAQSTHIRSLTRMLTCPTISDLCKIRAAKRWRPLGLNAGGVEGVTGSSNSSSSSQRCAHCCLLPVSIVRATLNARVECLSDALGEQNIQAIHSRHTQHTHSHVLMFTGFARVRARDHRLAVFNGQNGGHTQTMLALCACARERVCRRM